MGLEVSASPSVSVCILSAPVFMSVIVSVLQPHMYTHMDIHMHMPTNSNATERVCVGLGASVSPSASVYILSVPVFMSRSVSACV